jgi:hypothetical protein
MAALGVPADRLFDGLIFCFMPVGEQGHPTIVRLVHMESASSSYHDEIRRGAKLIW